MEWLNNIPFIHSFTGLLHTVVAIFCMVFGTAVLLNTKGTKTHKRLGYIYFVCMLILNLSAFGIYNFGSFSIFHGFALISLLSILLGMWPAWRRKNDSWLIGHFYFMNWSVVGLYCAFWAELGVRLFDMRHFWWVVMIISILTSAVGAVVINKKAKEMKLN